MANYKTLNEALQSQFGRLPSVAERRQLFELGGDYVGNANQNISLLNRINQYGFSSVSNQSTQSSLALTPKNQSSLPLPNQSIQPTGSNQQAQQQQIVQQVNQQQQQTYNNLNQAPVNPNLTAQQIKQIYPGYAGWNDESAILANFKETGGSGKGGPVQLDSSGQSGGGTFQQPLTDIANRIVQTTNEYVTSLQNNEFPEVDYQASLEQLLQESGLIDLQSSQQSLAADIEDIKANAQLEIANLQNTGGARGVIGAKTSDINKQAQQQLDILGRQYDRLTREISVKQSGVQMAMDALNMDYDAAVNKYEATFKSNAAVYQALTGALETTLKVQEQQQNTARSNLQTVMSIAAEGGLDISQMSSQQVQQIRQLEMQAGLPSGFATQAIFNAAQNSWKTQAIKEREVNGVIYYDQLLLGPGGELRVVSHKGGVISTGSSGGGSGVKQGSSEYNSLLGSATARALQSVSKSGYVSPQLFDEVRRDYEQAGGNIENFIRDYWRYTDPNITNFQQNYGFSINLRQKYAGETNNDDPISNIN